MNLDKTLDKVRFADTWRSLLGVPFFGGFGLLLVVLTISEGLNNGEMWGLFAFGLLCIGFGAYFGYRVKKLREIHQRVRGLLDRPAEIAKIEVQEIVLQHQRRVWNVFVHPRDGGKLRMAIYRRDMHDELVPMLHQIAPQAFTAAR